MPKHPTAPATPIDIPVGDVRFVLEFYPRTKTRTIDARIEQYRDCIDMLPPITVANGGVLVDGMHRLQAHIREGRTTIKAVDLGELTDHELVNYAYQTNSQHGEQLTAAEKRVGAARMWASNPDMTKDERIAHIAEILSISADAVYFATKDQRKYELDSAKETAWDLWLNCATQQSIADTLGVSVGTVNKWLSDSGSSQKLNEHPESRQHFDIWSFQTASDESGQKSYFGRMPPQVVENLLWFYTEPGNVVVDPFVGGGTTIDVAKAMGRRVWASDRKPSTPTLPIHEHDITTGWPAGAPKKADLIILDPPYWQQAAGRYSDDAADLGNMGLEEFRAAWAQVVKVCAGHLTGTGRIAYIISPTQLEDGTVVDHATDMLTACDDEGLTVERRIIVPYQTQQATGQQVTWARENKRMLKLYRDLVVLS